MNRVLIRPSLDKTPYELWKNKKPNISFFKVLGCKCFILNTKDNLEKLDAKSNVRIFLSYSSSSKAYKVFNKKTMVVEESIHVVFDESNDSLERRESVDDDVGLGFSMGRLQIEDEVHQQEEDLIKRRKKNHLWTLLHLLNLNKENLVKDFQESGNLSQIIHNSKL